jgi:hypothetical protein
MDLELEKEKDDFLVKKEKNKPNILMIAKKTHFLNNLFLKCASRSKSCKYLHA